MVKQFPNAAVFIAAAYDITNRQSQYTGIPRCHRRNEVAGHNRYIHLLCQRFAIHALQLTENTKQNRNPHTDLRPVAQILFRTLYTNPVCDLTHKIGYLPFRIVPAFPDGDPVSHAMQTDRVSSHGKIYIPTAQFGIEKKIDHLGNALIKWHFQQGIYFRFRQVRLAKRNIQSPVRPTQLTQGTMCRVGIPGISGGYIQHFFITPKALFQKISITVCSSSPR